jgi:hypothetical protein
MSDGSGELDAGWSGAHQYKGHLAGAFLRVIGRRRQFKRTQDPGSNRFGVVQALEAWCERRELVMTEIARTHTGGDHQEVIRERSVANPRTSNVDEASSEIDALNLRQRHAEILLFRLELPDRRRYLGRRQNSGGDLVQERLKDMVITPIDQRYFDFGSLQCPRCRDARETAADDQDVFFARDRLYRWLFVRKRFGQNCSHGITHGLKGQPPDQYGIQRGSGPILNCAAVDRTSMPVFVMARGQS